MKNLHQQVLELLPQCIEDRRWLHRHAELSFREYKTADYLEQALCELEGLELSRPTPTSVMAVLRTGRPGRCLAIRADIDALPTGSFGVCSGVLTSATDRFEIEITGRGGHSSMPQECIDPIVTGAQIILALQTVLSRSLRPSDPAVLSVCQAHSGSAYNIIPGSMHLTGSVRSYDERVRATAERRIREISEGIAASAGADVQVEYVRGYDSIRNDPALTGWARNMIAQTFGTQAVHELSPIAPGDDFCYYDQVCPGFFLELGAANPEKGSDAPHHNARYRLDEDALAYGMEYTVALLSGRCCLQAL